VTDSLRERVARTLCLQKALNSTNHRGNPDEWFGIYWDIILTERIREHYRTSADEVIAMIRKEDRS
jgi:hypothetical protein